MWRDFPWRKWLLIAGLFIVAIQGLYLTYGLSQVVDSRPIIGALDNDAANAIDVASRSRWYLDNGFAGYGALYFRLAYTVQGLLPDLKSPGDQAHPDPSRHSESRTRTIHLALLLVSLISLIALVLFLGWAIFGFTYPMPFASALFLQALMSSEIWKWGLLVAHPDILLTFLASVATWLTYQAWANTEDLKLQKYSAWAWGLALATKMSMILFYPFALLGFLIIWREKPFRQALRFIGQSAVVYFAVGFPQSLNIPRTLRFLTYQSQFSQPATWESILGWFQIYGQQAMLPALILLACLALNFNSQAFLELRSRHGLQVAAFIVGPFALILLQKILAPHDHYMMPVIATQFTMLIALFANRSHEQGPRTKAWIALPSLAILSWLFLPSVFGLDQKINQMQKCRPEARIVFNELMELQATGRKIYVDPYVPTLDKTPNVRSIWTADRDYILNNSFDVLVLNARHYQSLFAEKNLAYLQVDNPNLSSTQKFYSLFMIGENVQDSTIGRWERKHSDICGWSLWQKVVE